MKFLRYQQSFSTRVFYGMLKLSVGIVISLAYSPVWSESPAQLIERIEIPPEATLQIVSTDSVYNSVQSAMATISSASSVDSVLNFYRSAWGVDAPEDMPAFIESQIPGWSLISKLEGRNNIVVQINSSGPGTSAGFISVMAIDQQLPAEPHGVFSDLIPVTSNHSVDGVDVSLMRVYGSNASVFVTHGSLRQRLVKEGWKVMIDSEVEGSRVLILSQGSSRLEVSFVDSSRFASAVVVHRLTSH